MGFRRKAQREGGQTHPSVRGPQSGRSSEKRRVCRTEGRHTFWGRCWPQLQTILFLYAHCRVLVERQGAGCQKRTCGSLHQQNRRAAGGGRLVASKGNQMPATGPTVPFADDFVRIRWCLPTSPSSAVCDTLQTTIVVLNAVRLIVHVRQPRRSLGPGPAPKTTTGVLIGSRGTSRSGDLCSCRIIDLNLT